MVEHLTADRLATLLREPRANQELVEHLAAGCEACDAFLAQHRALDGEVDRALLSLKAAAAPQLDEVGWARLRRSLGTGSGDNELRSARPASTGRSSPGSRARRAAWLVVPLAAALALAALAPRLLRDPSDGDGLKGPEAPLLLELTAAVKLPDGAIARVDNGATLKPDGVLIFRYHATQSADGSVWVQRAKAPPVKLGDVRLESGTHELGAGASLVGVSLEGEVGELGVWVIAGKARTDHLDPVTAARAVDSRGDVALGRLTVLVQP